MFSYPMTEARARTHVASITVATLWCLFAAACTNSSNSTGLHTGSLTVTVTAPGGVTPAVTVSGPAGYNQTITATRTLSGLATGSYTVSAASAVATNPIVATVYAGNTSGSPATVTAGSTGAASVNYAQQPGSGGLWVANFSTPTVAEYGAAQLAATTAATPATALGTGAANPGFDALAFDAGGNLWVAEGLSSAVVEYSAAQLASNGSPRPAVTLSASGGSLSAPEGIAFDNRGNLWVPNSGASVNTVVEFGASQMSASGSPTPQVTLSANGSSLNGPIAVAFDPSGNMWVANGGGNTVVEFTPAQLAASGSPVPVVTLSDSAGSLNGPVELAFDASGNLWVADFNSSTVVAFTPNQLAASGSPIPSVTLSATGGSLDAPVGLAFDASGDLWVANEFGNTVVEFAASQLVTSGSPTPNVTVSGSSLDHPFGLAFDPHAPNLPVKP